MEYFPSILFLQHLTSTGSDEIQSLERPVTFRQKVARFFRRRRAEDANKIGDRKASTRRGCKPQKQMMDQNAKKERRSCSVAG